MLPRMYGGSYLAWLTPLSLGRRAAGAAWAAALKASHQTPQTQHHGRRLPSQGPLKTLCVGEAISCRRREWRRGGCWIPGHSYQ